MSLSREELCRCVPHAGSMCLLNEVTRWDEERIFARAINHNDADNPLRHGRHLPALCAIEYAAQAMAIHGALMAKNDAAPRVALVIMLFFWIARHNEAAVRRSNEQIHRAAYLLSAASRD